MKCRFSSPAFSRSATACRQSSTSFGEIVGNSLRRTSSKLRGRTREEVEALCMRKTSWRASAFWTRYEVVERTPSAPLRCDCDGGCTGLRLELLVALSRLVGEKGEGRASTLSLAPAGSLGGRPTPGDGSRSASDDLRICAVSWLPPRWC